MIDNREWSKIWHFLKYFQQIWVVESPNVNYSCIVLSLWPQLDIKSIQTRIGMNSLQQLTYLTSICFWTIYMNWYTIEDCKCHVRVCNALKSIVDHLIWTWGHSNIRIISYMLIEIQLESRLSNNENKNIYSLESWRIYKRDLDRKHWRNRTPDAERAQFLGHDTKPRRKTRAKYEQIVIKWYYYCYNI